MKEYLGIVDENILAVTMNRDMVITDASSAYCRISRMRREDIIGKSYLSVCRSNISADRHNAAFNTIRAQRVWSGEIEAYASDGTSFWVINTVSPKYGHDGTLLGYVSIGQDITARKLVEKLSITDSLTRINNRLKLDEIFNYELEKSRRYRHTFSIVMIDLDGFKEVNDTFGHQAGDQVLCMVAEILANNTRMVDTAGRWGGDGFMLVCPETNAAAALIIAEKIRSKVDRCYFPKVGHMTVSLGIATFQKQDTQESLLNRADKALYLAKECGKNQVMIQEEPNNINIGSVEG